MPPAQPSRPVARRLVAALAAAAGLLALITPAAHAAGTPDIALDKRAPQTVLLGESARVTLEASSPAGEPRGYNLTFSDVLPAGVAYDGGATVAPTRVVTDAPGPGQTLLVWENVADLSGNSSFSIAYDVRPDPDAVPVGDSFVNQAAAYVNTDPREVPDVADTGVADAASFTGSATASATTTVTAVDIEKSEPSPEGELLRGVHDHATTYTLTIRNNLIRQSTNVRIADFLPAELEFLGCGGQDNTTDAPTNPGADVEYPGAPRLTAGTVLTSDCPTPGAVRTELTDPDAGGPLPGGVYTRADWQVPSLAPGQTLVIRYRAGIPIRENTLDWDGDGSPDLPAPAGSAPPTACDAGTGDCPQAANLDNTGGPETSEDGPGERPFTNLGRVLADFDVDGDPGTPDELVVDTDALTRFAEDLTVQKTVSPGTIAAGQLSAWTLVLRSGEYRTVDGLEVTDLVPDGLCPLGTSAPADAECQGGPGPSIPYSAAGEQAGGAWDLTWSTLPDLAASDELTLTYSTRTRAFYQQDFADERPVLNYDSWSNSVSLTGLDRVRLGSDGQPIDADEPGGINIIEDVDASSAGQSAPGPAIDKRVREPGGAVPVSCSTGAYIDTTAIAYGPGDRVCWELTATFPAGVFGRDVTITDFLPGGHEYEAGSAFQTGTSTAPVQSFSGSGELIEVVLGDPQGFVPAGRVFQGRFSSIVVDPEGDTGDVQGNLMKFSTTDSAGRTYPQRDRADVEYTEAALALVKGVRSVNGVPAGGNPPDTDGVSVAGGDVVTYRIDVTNTGGRDASAARVWDELPAQDTCADVSAISAGGTCNAAENRVEWTTGAITAGGSITLTYALTVPTTVAPAETLVNTAAVVSYTSATNRGGQFTYVPDNPTITDPGAGTPNAGPAEDGSSVTTPGGAVKTRTPTVDEPGNALAGQATIGERIRYTLEVSIAGGLTLTDGVLDDVVPAGQTVDPASATATLGGGPIPPTWTLSATASRVKLEAPSFANPPGAAVVLRVEFEVTLDDVPGNVRGGTATNRATLSFTNSLGQPVSRQSNQVSTRIVEPNLGVTKSEDDGNDQVVAGQVVRYTVDVVNSTTGASFVSPSHDTRAVDTVPAGISPLEAPCPSAPCDVAEDGDVIPPNGGVWNATARTITWGLGTIDPAGTAQRVYDAVVDEPALAGATLRNEVVVTGTSLLGVIPGERTAASATNAGYRDDDDAVVTIEGITQIDKLTPRVRTVGQDTTYTVIVTIPGGVRFRDVHVRDVLPDGIRYDGFTSSSCAGCGGAAPDVSATGLPPQPQPGGTTVLGFWLGDIDPAPVGSERIVTITYAAHVKAQLTDGTPIVADDTLENTAQVRWNVTTDLPGTPTATPPTADVLGDSASATVSVIEPQIEVDKDIAPDTADLDARDAQPGETLSYTLRIRNTGNQTAYDVIVDDRPADELEDVVLAAGLTTDLNTDGWTAADPDLAWLIPSLSPGAAVTLTYTAKVKAGADLPPADPVVATNVLDVPSYFGLPLADRELDAREYGGTFGPVTPDQVDVTIRRPQLSLVKTTGLPGSPDTGDARIGEPFPWRVVVTNGATTASAFAVDVTDTLPDGWDYVAGS
ncbi:MAG: DUF11 domain-containing protein, partial [Solirubrobacteraceae bacterium]|nr:DUF11 domain-containing protein [Solirubrobacteraceae bacterium]